MSVRLDVPETLRDELRQFGESRGVDIQIVAEPPHDCRVLVSDGRNECSPETLHKGGFIKCETARATAKRWSVPMIEFGSLLNLLDIKIRECGLGCF